MTDHSPTDAYLAARAEWNDRFAGQRKTLRLFTGITAVSLMIGLLGTGFGIYASINSRFIPYVVAIDKLGHARIAPSPQRVGDWPASVVRRELADFIRNIRTITPDVDTLRHDQKAAAALLRPGSAARRKISIYMRSKGHQPLALAQTETVSVHVTSVNYLSGSSWQVQWSETAYGRQTGQEISHHAYSATMVLAFQPVSDSGTLQLNPLGLYISQIDIQEAHA